MHDRKSNYKTTKSLKKVWNFHKKSIPLHPISLL